MAQLASSLRLGSAAVVCGLIPLHAHSQGSWPVDVCASAAAPPLPLSPSGQPMRLLQVQCVFRHGARPPVSEMPKDPVAWTQADTDRTGLPLCGINMYSPRSSVPLKQDR